MPFVFWTHVVVCDKLIIYGTRFRLRSVPIHLEVTNINHITIYQRDLVSTTLNDSIHFLVDGAQFIETRYNLSYSDAI